MIIVCQIKAFPITNIRLSTSARKKRNRLPPCPHLSSLSHNQFLNMEKSTLGNQGPPKWAIKLKEKTAKSINQPISRVSSKLSKAPFLQTTKWKDFSKYLSPLPIMEKKITKTTITRMGQTWSKSLRLSRLLAEMPSNKSTSKMKKTTSMGIYLWKIKIRPINMKKKKFRKLKTQFYSKWTNTLQSGEAGLEWSLSSLKELHFFLESLIN